MRRVEVGVLTALCLLVAVSAATAQRIVGTVHDAASGAVVSGAVVSILDVAGHDSARVISNQMGRYAIAWRDAAARIRVVHIGFRPAVLPLPKGAPHDTTIDLTMERVPVTLDAVQVAGKPLCAASGDHGAALDLWDQARAALLNSIVARTAMPVVAANLLYRQDLDLQTRRVTKLATRMTRSTALRPFAAALPAAELAAHGYTATRNGEETFYGPDADVLFDDSFTDAHCFGVRRDDAGHRGLVALTFEPRPVAQLDSVVDVRGDLWIDPKNAELVQLDFTYTGIDDVAKHLGAGGVIHFRSLSNGIVFVDYWSITLAALQRILNGRPARATNLSQSGGFVLAAQWPDSTRFTGRIGALRGVVTEKGQAGPASNIIVALDGVDTTVTDQGGRYLFGPLPDGLYSIHLIDTTYERYTARRIVSDETRVALGDTVTKNFQVPSQSSVIADVCHDQPDPLTNVKYVVTGGRSLILGQISDESNQWPRDLHIESAWLADVATDGHSAAPPKSNERTVSLDVGDGGRFHLCGVQRDRPVRLRALMGRLPIADTTVVVSDSVARLIDWRLPPGTFAQIQGDAAAFSGRVLSTGDAKPVPGADVWVANGDLHARTDSSGQFHMYGLRAGRQIVQVRRLGFSERLDTVTLRAGQEVVRTLSLTGSLVLLDTVHTTSPIVAYSKPMLQQFEMRRHTGVGRYIAESDLRKHDEQSMGLFLMARLGGIDMVGYKSYLFARSNRNAANSPEGGHPLAIAGDRYSPKMCWVSVYIDGAPLYTGAPGTDAPDFNSMRVDEFAGVEFYPGGASTPTQYNNTKEANCGVLLLWTREK